MEKNKKIAIIGKGNVGTHLVNALAEKVEVISVDSRSLANFPSDCILAIISVSDRAIIGVAESIAGKVPFIAHTSGSIGIESLKGTAPNYGVFYPLQTFTKGNSMSYSDIPFFIEGNNRQTVAFLSEIAGKISPTVIEADSEKRKHLHLASVFACNFSNHLAYIADNILREKNMDVSLLLPLLRRTVEKLQSLPPAEAQTGPAVREDYPVINSHLEMLSDKPEAKEIYQLLTSDIINTKHKRNLYL
ncbi:MAG: DUF2520 domain-containing protein [Muribaculaceae bacterium]|nr:DUF2520 domain-containing protein [Muribaculaceae bacterium]